jgi:hypothetical protein
MPSDQHAAEGGPSEYEDPASSQPPPAKPRTLPNPYAQRNSDAASAVSTFGTQSGAQHAAAQRAMSKRSNTAPALNLSTTPSKTDSLDSLSQSVAEKMMQETAAARPQVPNVCASPF